MSPELYLTGVLLLGVLLMVVGLVLAVRGRADAAPHQAGLGPLRITSPGPGIAITLVGTLLVVSRMIWPDLAGVTAEGVDGTSGPQESPSRGADGPTSAPTPSPPGPPAPTATETVTPDPAGVRHSLTVGIGAVDLDRARAVGLPEAYESGDLSFVVPGELVPLAAGGLAVADASSLAGCADALTRLDDPGLTTDELRAGAELCVETSEGAVAGVVVAPWRPETGELELSWTLWRP